MTATATPDGRARAEAVAADGPPAATGRRSWGRAVLTVWTALGFVYLFTPILFIVIFSFNQPNGRFNLVWQRFTLDNWLNPFSQQELTDAMRYSLGIAAVSTVTATVLGSLIAIAISRYEFRGKAGIDLLLVLPLTTPEIVLGASLANIFLEAGLQRGSTTIWIAHVMFSVSFVALTVKARIRGFDWSLEDAAADLGAGPWRTFRLVTFPLILPGIIAAGLLSFALSLDDFIITFFTAGARNTFPLQVWGGSRNGTPPQINVLATLVLVISVSIIGLGSLWQRRRLRTH